MANKSLSEEHMKQFRNVKLNMLMYRKDARMSQENVADSANISLRFYQDVENPDSNLACSLETLYCIADALGIEIHKLMTPLIK